VTRSSRDRVPPGQRLVTNFPVLHAGSVAHIDRTVWSLTVSGLIDPGFALDWNGLVSLPSTEQTCDLHCVTGWSQLDTHWKGVLISRLLEGQEVQPEARHVVVYAPSGWTTNLPIMEFLKDDVLLAYEYEGRPISPEHGGPVRLLIPQLYLWKSAKWIKGIEFTVDERLGYWESRGYHALGDPWLEQRYS
jgi:DMSO/TMAO reductase YedYZ molybdopterin-dependent catalytic subunit